MTWSCAHDASVSRSAQDWVPAPVMAGLGRHPAAVIATFVVVAFAAVFAAFLLLVRGVSSDPDPALEAAQGMAHRLLNGRESIDVDAQGAGRYVFRVVYQASDGNVGATLLATHVGVAVCARGGHPTQAARFSYLHFDPTCEDGRIDLRPRETSTAADRARYGGDFVRGADQQDEPSPRLIGA
jgi:hypothetical protein